MQLVHNFSNIKAGCGTQYLWLENQRNYELLILCFPNIIKAKHLGNSILFTAIFVQKYHVDITLTREILLSMPEKFCFLCQKTYVLLSIHTLFVTCTYMIFCAFLVEYTFFSVLQFRKSFVILAASQSNCSHVVLENQVLSAKINFH